MKRRLALWLVFAVGLVIRAGYVVRDHWNGSAAAAPILDAAYYLEWARAIAAGQGAPEGAFYLAPLYPYVLGFWFRVAGEALLPVYLLQQLAVVAGAYALARLAVRLAGPVAACATAVMVLGYHPALFFPSRLLGESLALGLLAGALYAASTLEAGRSRARAAGAGFLGGVSALARPNLLLVPLSWLVGFVASAFGGRKPERLVLGGLVLAGLIVAVGPVTVRNFLASRHLVPISSNAGLTLYHGNGPGARGVYTPAEGFSGRVDRQREEARVLASRAVGRELDAVEADRWFAREALTVRLSDIGGTARLLARKLGLLLSHAELSLDYPPELDENPWRYAAPVSLAWILAFAGAGVVLAGWRGTGGWTVWGAVGACAVTPLVFYVSSRYRLPFAMFLCLPAGVGAARLTQVWAGGAKERRRAVLALVTAGALWALSVGVPVENLRRSTHAVALANRASVKKSSGQLAGAEEDLRRALALDPGATAAWFNLGVVLEARGRKGEAEQAYRRALLLDPGHAEAAGNLAGLLVRSGRAAEAVPILRRALESRPDHAVCWTNLVVALASAGDLEGARAAAAAAAGAGVRLHPELLQAIGMGGHQQGGGAGARMRRSDESLER